MGISDDQFSHPTPSRELVPGPKTHSTPSHRSRGASLNITVEDSMSSTLSAMTNSTDVLRKAKCELAEQNCLIESLRSLLETANNEKAELYRRLATTKDAAMKASKVCAQSLDDIQASFDLIKKQSEAAPAYVTRVRSSIIELAQGRNDLSDYLTVFRPLINEDCDFVKTAGKKSLLIELQAECEHMQEMAAMLRQKLITVGGAFLVAQERIMKLELNSLDAESSLNQPAAMLLSLNQPMPEIAGVPVSQKEELLETLSWAADAEARLITTNNRIMELSHQLHQSNHKE